MLKRLTFSFLFLFTLVKVSKSQETATTSIPTNDSLHKSILHLKKDLDILKNLKISGWIQAQYQYADTVGAKNFDGGDFPSGSDQRFMIRRGRVKFTYNQKNSQYVLQINATERGVNLVDFFGKYTDPWLHAFSLTAGVMNRPFGYEIQQSSVDRETPERSRFVQILLPNERDIGAMVTFQPAKGKPLFGLKADLGLYNGTGIAVPGTGPLAGSTNPPSGITGVNGFTDFDRYKDIMGHLVYTKTTKDEKIKFGIGASVYNGGFAYQNNIVYNSIKTDTSGNKIWVAADTNGIGYKGKKAPREYYGAEAQFSIKTVLGTTSLRAEYVTGTQSGKVGDARSPQSAPNSGFANYTRNFDAGNVYFIHRIGKSKHELAVKYEWFDPNNKISASDLNGKNGMKEGEIKYTMLGVGYNLYLDNNVKFMFHYNIVTNETTKISGYTRDLKDNILTIRMQYRF